MRAFLLFWDVFFMAPVMLVLLLFSHHRSRISGFSRFGYGFFRIISGWQHRRSRRGFKALLQRRTTAVVFSNVMFYITDFT